MGFFFLKYQYIIFFEVRFSTCAFHIVCTLKIGSKQNTNKNKIGSKKYKQNLYDKQIFYFLST